MELHGDTIEVLTSIPFKLNEEPLMARMRVEPGTADAADLRESIEKARSVARPKAVCAESFVEERSESAIRIGAFLFESRMLLKNLAGTHRVFPFIATCGSEMDKEAPDPADFLRHYWWEAIKAELLACAIEHLNDFLGRRFHPGKTSSMSPGSGDARVWPIEQQKGLFAIFGDTEKLIGVRLTPSFLMVPNKSVSGIRFQTETDFQSCQLCRRKTCENRKAPFDEHLWKKTQDHG